MTDFLLDFIIELHCKKGRGPGDHKIWSKSIFQVITVIIIKFPVYFATASSIWKSRLFWNPLATTAIYLWKIRPFKCSFWSQISLVVKWTLAILGFWGTLVMGIVLEPCVTGILPRSRGVTHGHVVARQQRREVPFYHVVRSNRGGPKMFVTGK